MTKWIAVLFVVILFPVSMFASFTEILLYLKYNMSLECDPENYLSDIVTRTLAISIIGYFVSIAATVFVTFKMRQSKNKLLLLVTLTTSVVDQIN
ncbi:hypothetical protein ABF162_26510 (plasmid) [Vibrio coralliilyticus]|uniref:hypothetical protein n=1 Tax=Vibrio coralliilyticus TaxID=190893 RepID=UPI00051272DB|nr:hypothetical protein [Vibrio coralliilyticus]AIS58244.1 hypothetical protein JV59_24680 [Vibrio coralliilyticus]